MPQNRSPRQYNATFKAVIDCALDSSEAALLPTWANRQGELQELEELLVTTGYEVSIRANPKHENFSVCIKGVMSDCINVGYWLYGNGNTCEIARKAAFFKHFEIFEQKEWKNRGSSSNQLAT